MPRKTTFTCSVLTFLILITAACSASQLGAQKTFYPDDPNNPQVSLEGQPSTRPCFEPGKPGGAVRVNLLILF